MKSALNYPKLVMLVILALGGLWFSQESHAQRINFSTWTGSDDITITPVMASPNLNFNQKQANISANSPAVTINLADAQTVAFRIEAPEGFDITVEVDAPMNLTLDNGVGGTGKEIPFTVALAYSNVGLLDPETAKGSSLQLPPGFLNVTFPINRRTGSAPGPPPTPESGDTPRVKATALLYIFGTLGPIGTVDAGLYSGDITINVFFSSND